MLSYEGVGLQYTIGVADFIKDFPEAGYLLDEFGKRDLRKDESRKPTVPGQLLRRNATSTKKSYKGAGLAAI